MKKLLAVLLVFSLLAVPAAFAAGKNNNVMEQMTSDEGVNWAKAQNLVTVGPLGLLLGLLNARYERALNDDNGIGAGLLYRGYSLAGWSYTVIGGEVDYNWYFQHHAPNGWFAGPAISLLSESSTYSYNIFGNSTSGTVTATFVGIGGHGGYRWIWDSGFTLDVSATLEYLAGNVGTVNGVEASGISGTLIIPGVDLGWAF